MKKILLVLITSLFFSSLASAEGGSSTGGTGGDTRASDFVVYANRIAEWAVRNPDLIRPEDATAMQEYARTMTKQLDGDAESPVEIVDEIVRDKFGVRKMATFQKNPLLVKVDSNRWEPLTTMNKFKLVGLELFGLAGVDRRYDVAQLVEKHFSDIAGNAAKSKSDLRIESSPTLSAIYGLYREEIERAAGCGSGNRRKIENIYTSGEVLAELEEKQTKNFLRNARLFRDLPTQFQLDVLASGTAVFESPKDTQSWKFSAIDDVSSPGGVVGDRLSSYVNQIDCVLDFYRKNEKSLKMTKEQKTAVEKLSAKAKEALQYTNSSHWPNKPNNRKAPYNELLRAQVIAIRREIAEQNCEVPTTFDAGIFASPELVRKRIQEARKIKPPSPEEEEALLNAAEKDSYRLQSVLRELVVGFGNLERLDKENKDSRVSNVTGGFYESQQLVGIAEKLASANEENAKAEVASLKKMRKGLRSGELCNKFSEGKPRRSSEENSESEPDSPKVEPAI